MTRRRILQARCTARAVDDTADVPWWDPRGRTLGVDPDADAVVVDGVPVSPRAAWSGCTRRAVPTPRTCSSPIRSPGSPRSLSDVDGGMHVALVLVDDPAADLHDWYGRYFYFAPGGARTADHREESRP